MTAQIRKVSTTEFVDEFQHWSSAAKTSPIMVTDRETGAVEGYFISAHDYAELQALCATLPTTGFAWEMSPEMAAEIERPLPADYPDPAHS